MNEIIQWFDNHNGFMTFVLTIVWIVTTIYMVKVMIGANELSRKNLAQATELEKERSRPYIVFDLITERSCIFAVLRNIGLTHARDVKITVHPQLKGIHDRGTGGNFEIPFLVHGVPMMPPSREIKDLVEHWNPFLKSYPSLRFEGVVSYKNSDEKQFTEPFVIDLNSEKDIVRIGVKDIHNVAENLETIAGCLRNIMEDTHRPLIRVIPEHEYIAQQEKLENEQRERKAEFMKTRDKQKQQANPQGS